MGQSIPIVFTITNDKGELDQAFSGNLNITHTGNSKTCWKATSDVLASCISDTSVMLISGGTATYYLFSDVLAKVSEITASVVGMDKITSSAGTYEFIKKVFTLSPEPLKLMAGKQDTITVTAVQKNLNGATVMEDYEGKKTLQLSTSFVSPSTGTLQPSLVANEVEFVKSVGTLTLKYNDTGQISVKIRNSSGDIEGDLVVESRPHHLALCAPSVQHTAKAHNGTSSSGSGFAHSGETFAVKIKPTIYDTSKSDPCQRATTPNFYSSSVHSALAELSHALDTPSGGKKGELTQEGNAYSPSNTYEFSSSR